MYSCTCCCSLFTLSHLNISGMTDTIYRYFITVTAERDLSEVLTHSWNFGKH